MEYKEHSDTRACQNDFYRGSFDTFTVDAFEHYLLQHDKIGWQLLPFEHTLNVLHKVFSNSNKIDCTAEEFADVILGRSHKQLRWRSFGYVLMWVFSALMDKGFVPQHGNLAEVLCRYFVNRRGKPFKPKSLETMNSRKNNLLAQAFVNTVIDALTQAKGKSSDPLDKP